MKKYPIIADKISMDGHAWPSRLTQIFLISTLLASPAAADSSPVLSACELKTESARDLRSQIAGATCDAPSQPGPRFDDLGTSIRRISQTIDRQSGDSFASRVLDQAIRDKLDALLIVGIRFGDPKPDLQGYAENACQTEVGYACSKERTAKLAAYLEDSYSRLKRDPRLQPALASPEAVASLFNGSVDELNGALAKAIPPTDPGRIDTSLFTTSAARLDDARFNSAYAAYEKKFGDFVANQLGPGYAALIETPAIKRGFGNLRDRTTDLIWRKQASGGVRYFYPPHRKITAQEVKAAKAEVQESLWASTKTLSAEAVNPRLDILVQSDPIATAKALREDPASTALVCQALQSDDRADRIQAAVMKTVSTGSKVALLAGGGVLLAAGGIWVAGAVTGAAALTAGGAAIAGWAGTGLVAAGAGATLAAGAQSVASYQEKNRIQQMVVSSGVDIRAPAMRRALRQASQAENEFDSHLKEFALSAGGTALDLGVLKLIATAGRSLRSASEVEEAGSAVSASARQLARFLGSDRAREMIAGLTSAGRDQAQATRELAELVQLASRGSARDAVVSRLYQIAKAGDVKTWEKAVHALERFHACH